MKSLRDIPLFSAIDENLSDKYSKRCEWKEYQENELIFDAADDSKDLLCVISGRVRVINYVAVGKQVFLGEIGAKGFFGEIAAIDNEARTANVTALTKTELCIIPQRVFQSLLWESRETNFEILRVLVKRIRKLNASVAEQSFLQPKYRIYIELLRLSETSYVNPEHRVISPSPALKILADRTGIKIEEISRELENLQKHETIELREDALVLTDVHKLQNQISDAWNK